MSRDEINKSTASQHHLPNRLYYDSGQSSMEYWDYSVEIECLKGPQGFSFHSTIRLYLFLLNHLTFLFFLNRCGSGSGTWTDATGAQPRTGIDCPSATGRHRRPNARNGGKKAATHQMGEFLRLPLPTFPPFPARFRQFVPFVFAGRSPFSPSFFFLNDVDEF